MILSQRLFVLLPRSNVQGNYSPRAKKENKRNLFPLPMCPIHILIPTSKKIMNNKIVLLIIDQSIFMTMMIMTIIITKEKEKEKKKKRKNVRNPRKNNCPSKDQNEITRFFSFRQLIICSFVSYQGPAIFFKKKKEENLFLIPLYRTRFTFIISHRTPAVVPSTRSDHSAARYTAYFLLLW